MISLRMQNLRFPIEFTFKISTLSNDFTAVDSTGYTFAYVRQKMFKLKEDIEVFRDESRIKVNYRIKADRWLDWSAAYSFYNESDGYIGKVARKGWASIWKAAYEIIDQQDRPQYHIREESGWVKVLDGIVGEIPILNFFTGYILNPSYIVTDELDKPIARLKKNPSLWGRRFTVEKLENFDQDDAERIVLSLMMMILLERRRG